MLTSRYKDVFNRLLHPLAAAIARTGVPPSAITLAAPLLTAVVCWEYLRTRATMPFCLAMAAVGCLDALDGAVARAGRRATAFGAYLDAMCDRYVDSLVALTVAHVSGYWLLCMVALAGGLLVSYAKARAAMEVAVSNLEWPDLMERAERSALFLGGLAASALLPWRPLGRDLFWWALVVLCVLTHLTVVQRMVRAAQFIKARRR
ncbi:MAG: CDP-alcohol phosphatidyltransferase family protein [Candidatus Omnitrophica bacterium]|nr:CDP-alcohol phosphatidyltransferase family protein [Candidatus Omnitrophota bacterium]